MENENKEEIVEIVDDKLTSIDLNEDELKQRKLMLLDYELKKIESDLQLEEMEAQLDGKIPNKFLDDDIIKTEKAISENKTLSGEQATESDLEYLNIRLKFLNKTKELDVPMKRLRYQIQELRYAKNRPDAPEAQIAKLEKELRERRMVTLKSRVRSNDSLNMIG